MQRQTIFGFGGAVTDSAAINIKYLSEEAQDNLIKMHFGSQGSRYNIIRINIAACDFSVRGYSYDDVEGDVDLVYFNLTEEDYNFKIPVIKEAIDVSPEEIYIFGSPWSPPAWMKTNGEIDGQGKLLKEMWQPYANYLVKFFQMYEDHLGVQLWGFTPENEPLISQNYTFLTTPNCVFLPEEMRDWISTVLGPTLEEAEYDRLKLMIYDYNQSLDNVHDMDPTKFILYSEACTGSHLGSVVLGAWDRGEQYVCDIIEDTNHWATGWVDWNIVLDTEGGPNWINNYVDAPVIVNATADEFYIQPLYYALSLFSRNVPRGSVHIFSDVDNDNLKTTAFINPDGEVVLIVANFSDEEHTLGVFNEDGVYVFKYTINARTWLALTYKI
ncbi:Endo-1,6-beta-D-glucanase [Armadillidium nasatum]|uniref:Glucosylceramidase n=1 Tax=Armadillidium nasatum TaxID=96803 RepID=A0A5N5STU0_9CRUS|nr:Endo-1,6-beta-D-glucanase [Armadillidium nasatum]